MDHKHTPFTQPTSPSTLIVQPAQQNIPEETIREEKIIAPVPTPLKTTTTEKEDKEDSDDDSTPVDEKFVSTQTLQVLSYLGSMTEDDQKKSTIRPEQRRRFPNRVYESLLELDDNQPLHYTQQREREQRIIIQLKQLRQELGSIVFNTLLIVPNQHGDTLLTLAAHHQCYALIIELLSYEGEARSLLADQTGKTIIDILCGQRLPDEHKAASCQILADLLALLARMQLLGGLLWRRDPHSGFYPIHHAVLKAVHTQQVEVVELLLSYDRPLPGTLEHKAFYSQLQAIDQQHNTPLQLAIQEQARVGSGLPIIQMLLQPRYHCPLHLPNAEQKTALDLTREVCRSSHPLWGHTVWEALQQAEKRYYTHLVNIGFVSNEHKLDVEEKKSSPVDILFFRLYKAAQKQQPKRTVEYQSLYRRYRGLYTPLLDNNVTTVMSLLDTIGTAYVQDQENAAAMVKHFQSLSTALSRYRQEQQLLQTSLTPPPGQLSWCMAPTLTPDVQQSLVELLGAERLAAIRRDLRDEAAVLSEIQQLTTCIQDIEQEQKNGAAHANFYQEIERRSADVARYRTLWISTYSTARYLRQQKDVMPDLTPIPSVSALTGQEQVAALIQASLPLAKLAAQNESPAFSTLQELLSCYGLSDMRAAIISAFNWQRITSAQQSQLITALFGQQFSRLTLQNFQSLQHVLPDRYRQWGDTIWEALFRHNTTLQVLELQGCDRLPTQALWQLTQWCPQLETLTIRQTPVTGFYQQRSLLTRLPLKFLQLQTLELIGCAELTYIACEAPQLRQCHIEKCPELTQLWLDALQLTQINGCELTSLQRLETKQAGRIAMTSKIQSSEPTVLTLTPPVLEQKNRFTASSHFQHPSPRSSGSHSPASSSLTQRSSTQVDRSSSSSALFTTTMTTTLTTSTSSHSQSTTSETLPISIEAKRAESATTPNLSVTSTIPTLTSNS